MCGRVYIYTRVCGQVCIRICIHECMVRMYACMHMHMYDEYVCMRACMHTCVPYVHILSTWILGRSTPRPQHPLRPPASSPWRHSTSTHQRLHPHLISPIPHSHPISATNPAPTHQHRNRTAVPHTYSTSQPPPHRTDPSTECMCTQKHRTYQQVFPIPSITAQPTLPGTARLAQWVERVTSISYSRSSEKNIIGREGYMTRSSVRF